MKAVLLSNQARSMANFWRTLVSAMVARNIEIVFAVPPGEEQYDQLLREMGGKIVNYSLDRKGINPLHDMSTYFELKKIFAAEKPELLFATTIKPVIYGCLAAHAEKVPCIYATITGLGYAFETDTVPKKIINRISRTLYRHSLKYATGIFFQNRDDAELFKNNHILYPDARIIFARGTGVDTARFAPEPFPPLETGIVFLLVGRLLEAKGIPEFAEACAILKKKYPQVHCQVLGPAEQGRGSISREKMAEFEKMGIEYLGEASDVRPVMAKSHVVVLPSWREGVPTAIMEAMSMGRPCVATNVPGCREVVIPNTNGFLADARSPASLAMAMEKFIKSPELVASMGEKSRKMAVDKFDANKVAQGILENMLHFCSVSGGSDHD